MSSVPSTKSVMDGVDTLPTVVILLLATTSILPDILRNGGGPALARALEPGDRKAPSSDFGVPSMYQRRKYPSILFQKPQELSHPIIDYFSNTCFHCHWFHLFGRKSRSWLKRSQKLTD